MVDSLENRLVDCSVSVSSDNFGCGPGGLIELAVSVVSKMRALSKSLDLKVSQESITFVGLLHSIGSIGDVDGESLLLPQDSSWHIDHGVLYKYNDAPLKLTCPLRSLFILSSFGIQMSIDEWAAIAQSMGQHREENRQYIGHESPLSLLLTTSRQWVFNDRVDN